MRTLTNRFLRHVKPLKPEAIAQHRVLDRREMPTTETIAMFLLAIASAGLYGLLYRYGNDLIAMARSVHEGHKALFFIPIVIAFAFSLIHGAFTGYFWDALGLRPRKN